MFSICIQKYTVRRQAASLKTQVVEIQTDLQTDQKCQALATRTIKVERKTAQQRNFTETSALSDEQAPSTKPLPPSPVLSSTKPSVLRAHQRFAYLSEPLSSTTPSNATQPTSAVATETATERELTQTQSAVTFDLPLPHDFRVLLELFRSCDTVVSMLHNRSEICGFDKLKPAVQEVVRRNFEEMHVGQFLTIYPMVYLLRFEKQLDKYTRRPSGNYVLVLSPNLRTDGTQIGHDSPSKGHLVFTGTRLIQRRNRFHRLLLGHVFRAHREFLHTKLGIDSTGLPNDTELRRWHPKFCLESMVPPIQPTPLPIRPSATEEKITSAKDAVRAFQARALFREADICQNVALLRHDPMPTIPSPTKASACSPRKPTVQSASSIALFTSSAASVPPSSPSVACSLKGVSETLLAKQLINQNNELLMRKNSNFLLDSIRYYSDVVADHLKVLQEFCSTWLEKLDWASPHLRLKNPDLPIGEVIASVRERLAAEGFNV
ncbi:chromatin licensing and DNA replication factor 1 [Paragonimus westermani]|uniref:Chromatin licensing and DNA replication factor 1 n=1 Tax=Paragonimus westermani TaxID=34504 RepID=A0A5J4NS12_9TREM|nr:chromatin licensing and DNA replication factor 1 [Paragonimus westermani]